MITRRKPRIIKQGRLLYSNEKGIALVAALLFLLVLTVVGATAVMVSTTDMEIGSNYKIARQAFYAAEGGSEYAVSSLGQLLATTLYPNVGSITAPNICGRTFDTFTIQPVGSQTHVDITSGNFSGLKAFIQKYEITSQARVNGTNGKAGVVQVVEDELIPLFQFGVFYEDDLEIIPGPNMTFSGGRIHSNSDIYLKSNSTLSIDSVITSAGDILNRRKDGDTASGAVRIKDAAGHYQAMNIDSDSGNWTSQSQTTWNGRVKTADHGIERLNLPLPTTNNPIDIIKRGNASDSADLKAAKMYWKAGLRIIDGTAYDKDDTPVNIKYYDPSYAGDDTPGDPATNVDPISSKTFHDTREGKNITVTTVDVDKLKSSPNGLSKLNSPPPGSDPGILYVSDSGTSKGVRLVNGADLPAGGLTVASDNPVYIQGNYNTDNRPAAVCGDAVTILSNNWNDANSNSSVDARIASNTTVKAAIMAGNKGTAGSQYSGGLENFPRFLENWSGKTFSYSGSLVCLWESEQATGDWHYGAPVYTAPNRDWSYGINPANLPPGTPRVRNLTRIQWSQQ